MVSIHVYTLMKVFYTDFLILTQSKNLVELQHRTIFIYSLQCKIFSSYIFQKYKKLTLFYKTKENKSNILINVPEHNSNHLFKSTV